MQLDRDVGLEQSLAIGMYIRFPFEAEQSDNEFRDFRIGQIRVFINVDGGTPPGERVITMGGSWLSWSKADVVRWQRSSSSVS
jgi:hypothetical protein